MHGCSANLQLFYNDSIPLHELFIYCLDMWAYVHTIVHVLFVPNLKWRSICYPSSVLCWISFKISLSSRNATFIFTFALFFVLCICFCQHVIQDVFISFLGMCNFQQQSMRLPHFFPQQSSQPGLQPAGHIGSQIGGHFNGETQQDLGYSQPQYGVQLPPPSQPHYAGPQQQLSYLPLPSGQFTGETQGIYAYVYRGKFYLWTTPMSISHDGLLLLHVESVFTDAHSIVGWIVAQKKRMRGCLAVVIPQHHWCDTTVLVWCDNKKVKWLFVFWYRITKGCTQL